MTDNLFYLIVLIAYYLIAKTMLINVNKIQYMIDNKHYNELFNCFINLGLIRFGFYIKVLSDRWNSDSIMYDLMNILMFLLIVYQHSKSFNKQLEKSYRKMRIDNKLFMKFMRR